MEKHRIYKNRLCVCFEKCDELDKDALIKARDTIFSSNLQVNYRFTFIPTFALNEVTPNNSFLKNFEKFAVEASLLTKKLVVDFDSFDAKRNLMISLIINSFLLNRLNVNIQDRLQLLIIYLQDISLIGKSKKIKIPNN
jgi:hypothetical protein